MSVLRMLDITILKSKNSELRTIENEAVNMIALFLLFLPEA